MTHTSQQLEADYELSSYDYPLQEGQIAQEPPEKRGSSRLCVLDRKRGNTLTDFASLAQYLPDNALIVANNSKVVPARMRGMSLSGKNAEFLLLTPLPLLRSALRDGGQCAQAEGLLKGSKRFRSADEIIFTPELRFRIEEKKGFGKVLGTLCWSGDLEAQLDLCGEPPLPPYIKRPTVATDTQRYQTVYAHAAEPGSVAAPTAGLHFDDAHVRALRAAGFGWAEVTLYVGYGTFSPIRCQDIREHEMHAEFVRIPEQAAVDIAQAKAQGRPVVAIGTTVARTLEGAVRLTGKPAPYTGWVNLFISPGFDFKVVDHLLTNFHLPRSSLLVLVSALAGRRRILSAYEQALQADFKVFSYGDAMLIL